MKVKEKPGVQDRVEQLTLSEHGNLVELVTIGLRATFYKSHFEALQRHFFDLEADYIRARAGKRPERSHGYHAKLYEKTLKRVHKAFERGTATYVRWLATGTATWLKIFIDHDDVVETVIDYFFNMSDAELNAETTQRARQLLLWQFYCLKEYSDKLQIELPDAV